jgi:hypothetical protein
MNPQPAVSSTAGYCMAIRGNGELQPAHWGAMASVVERLGLPDAMAGGSSATVSMFWLDAISIHPLIQSADLLSQKRRASLMLKSLLGFAMKVQTTNVWKNSLQFYGEIEKAKSEGVAQRLAELVRIKNWVAANTLLNAAIDLGLLDPVSFKPLLDAVRTQQVSKAQFYIQQFQETLSVFGKFNAATDDNLFFRPGLISFEKAAENFGRVAHFYSAAGASADVLDKWQKFFDTCEAKSLGLSWVGLLGAEPQCAQKFSDLFDAHFSQENQNIHLELRASGFSIPTIATTSVLVDKAAEEAQVAIRNYQVQQDTHYGQSFHITHPEQVRFGYWGKQADLDRIGLGLKSNLSLNSDEKSLRFLALGPATWKTVLSLSPAEPGLSPLKPFTASNGVTYVSAGGWSDLHPITVLKSYGCQDVVYITRRGGESLFAQGVAKRLLGFDRDWSLLSTSASEKTDRVKRLNDEGDPSDMNSVWSRLYNLANPKSSVKSALMRSTAILCTDWNTFDVKTQFVELIEDSYRSPYYVSNSKPATPFALVNNLTPRLTAAQPGCVP